MKQVKRDARDATVGFRCCGGTENAAKLDVPKPEEHPVLEPVDAGDAELQGHMASALKNGNLKSDAATEYFVEKAWHWRPVANEDLLVAKVGARDVATKSVRYWPAVLELCPGVAQTSNKLKALVDEMGEPEAKSEPIKGGGPRDERRLVTFSIKTGTESGEARLEYQYGQVAIHAARVGRHRDARPCSSLRVCVCVRGARRVGGACCPAAAGEVIDG